VTLEITENPNTSIVDVIGRDEHFIHDGHCEVRLEPFGFAGSG
jgi:hypothetical protein